MAQAWLAGLECSLAVRGTTGGILGSIVVNGTSMKIYDATINNYILDTETRSHDYK